MEDISPAGDLWTSVPISAIEHYAYCPRQAALIHLDRDFADNVDTQRGQLAHEIVDAGGPGVSRAGVRTWTALRVVHDELGMHGVCDVVESPGGEPVPVEHKSGSYRPGGAADLQVAAQVLCLRRMFDAAVPRGVIFGGRRRRRYDVTVDEALETRLRHVLCALRRCLVVGALPAPVNDTRCDRCSLKESCMPTVRVDTTSLFASRVLGEWDD
ncbi:CRISPR-associated protein Cas4 [Amycolatopsis alba]|uniref:CRISPR-associated exonuclease Cas4 n=1 Tax=Amycolatopsis alba DSM 44262 TaxID=1125972 RepID=A0A229RM58_AMYAL|nr:CRISPR-associated protein Cas4 [Amycolatopsis alba]OXM47541.1 CRISPR-associated protein Cas4 [Amycolatopsis alba DSM 44262]